MKLIGRIYKILPIFESSRDDYMLYIDSLYRELCGANDRDDLIQVKNKINFLILNESCHEVVRKTIFECINIIDKALSNWCE